jgi:hypothetical protein
MGPFGIAVGEIAAEVAVALAVLVSTGVFGAAVALAVLVAAGAVAAEVAVALAVLVAAGVFGAAVALAVFVAAGAVTAAVAVALAVLVAAGVLAARAAASAGVGVAGAAATTPNVKIGAMRLRTIEKVATAIQTRLSTVRRGRPRGLRDGGVLGFEV